MNVLVVTSTVPYPPEDGGKLRAWHLLREMSERHSITLATYAAGEPDPGALKAMREHVEDVVLLPRPSAAARARNAALSAIGSQPYTFRNYWSSVLAEKLREWDRAQHFDLIHFHHPQTGQHARILTNTPCVLDTHNVHWMIWERIADTIANPAARWFCRRQTRLMQASEPRTWEMATAVIAVSEQDAEKMRATVPTADVHVVPNGVDCEHFHPAPEAETDPTLVFTGSMSYQANVDGVLFFTDRIWPSVLSRCPRAKLVLVGGDPPEAVRRLAGGSITVTGRVDDVAPYLQSASLSIVPLRVGGGTRLKILEALAAGKPLVSTRVGAEGIPAEKAGGVVLADEPDAFARAVCDLLDDPGRRREMGGQGRQFVLAHHHWPIVGEELEAVYARAVGTQ